MTNQQAAILMWNEAADKMSEVTISFSRELKSMVTPEQYKAAEIIATSAITKGLRKKKGGK